ncbi:MAG: ribosome biogenesis factor YjgA [Succinivibrio sp.]
MSQQEQHFEGFDAAPEEESRSAHKREAQAVRKLIEQVANLGDQSFKQLVIPQDVKDALLVARKLKPRSDERRRQLQYCAKLMRFYEDSDLAQQVSMLGASSKEDPNTMRLEKLRENMITGGVEILNAFCSLILDTDRNKLRHLIKKAKEEASGDMEASKPNQRALFKYLKSEIARAGVQIPQELLK